MIGRLRWAHMGIVVLLLCVSVLAPPAHADRKGQLVIRDADSVLYRGVYYLNANMIVVPNSQVIKALNNGVPLIFKIKINLTRQRAFLWDPTVAQLKQSYRITYHVLSRRYVVHNMNSGQQSSYGSWRVAFRHLDYLRSVPIIDASLLEADEHYDVHVQAVLNVKIIPTGFGLLTQMFYGADQSSDWHDWTLK